jgi:hypothetical protein
VDVTFLKILSFSKQELEDQGLMQNWVKGTAVPIDTNETQVLSLNTKKCILALNINIVT